MMFLPHSAATPSACGWAGVLAPQKRACGCNASPVCSCCDLLHSNTDRLCCYLLRKHHRLGNIHLTQGCSGARRLCGAVAHRLGVWRRDLRPWFHVLRRTGGHHPKVRRRLFIRDRNLRRPCGVSGVDVFRVQAQLVCRNWFHVQPVWNQSASKVPRQSCDQAAACKSQSCVVVGHVALFKRGN